MRKVPCPKCGTVNGHRLVCVSQYPSYYYIECAVCGARTDICATAEESAIRWDRKWLENEGVCNESL